MKVPVSLPEMLPSALSNSGYLAVILIYMTSNTQDNNNPSPFLRMFCVSIVPGSQYTFQSHTIITVKVLPLIHTHYMC
jgi:hypothetical protein